MKVFAKKRRGFTLIEIIVSLAIIGIIAVSFLSVFVTGYSNIFAMGRKTQAMNDTAQSYLDEIYQNPTEETITNLASNPDVSIDYSTELDGLTLVKVTVTYNQDRSVTLSGLVPLE